MKYHLPIGTEITPISNVNGQKGASVLTTVVVDFDESDIVERIKQTIDGEEIEYICLSLGNNPSPYDCYIFNTNDIEHLKG